MPAVANDTSSIDQSIEQFDGIITNASKQIQEILRAETRKLYETVSNPPRYAAGTMSSVLQSGTFNLSEVRGIHIFSDTDPETFIVLNSNGILYRLKSVKSNIHGYIVSYPDLSTMQEVDPEDYVRHGKTALDKIKQAYTNNTQGGK